jgi:beta-glucuronidase
VYPWWDYGGIVRTPTFVVTPAVYIQKQRVTATPDVATGTAVLEATVWVRNTTGQAASSRLRLVLMRIEDGREVPVIAPAGVWEAPAETRAGEVKSFTMRRTLPRDAVRLWGLDHPTLYRLRAELATDPARVDADVTTFGIRRFEVRGTELHLNGQRVRLGGANRASDDPKFGLIEPAEIVERDLKLMKAAGMELQRIIHYATPPALLDLADRLGLLIIGEAGNWQLKPAQLDSPAIRSDFQNQTREMIERDWNHPSVVAWSVGNEYESQTPAGVRWTKDMVAFVRSLDPTRPVTFASFKADRAEVMRPEDEGSHYVDFVSVNMYGPATAFAERLDLLHRRWPDKPVFISEFGVRADKVPEERDREAYFRDVMAVIRPRPFVAAASVWTFNDYRSRYPDTAPNGYRPWGLVDQHRVPRGAYRIVAEEFAAARVVAAAVSLLDGRFAANATVEARADFPARPMNGLTLRLRSADAARVIAERVVPELVPGQRVELVIDAPAGAAGAADSFSMELVRPDGSVIHRLDRVARATVAGMDRP